MSNPVRVAFVLEGPTDYVILRAAVRSLLGGRDFEPTCIRPELDENLRAMTGGWGGVYRWCRQVVEQTGGPARSNPLFALHDVVVIHLDADVAGMRYSDCGIKDPPNDDLPCEQPCPPPSATTDALRGVVLGWLDENAVPPGAVFCTPSKSIETWVLVALFPGDSAAHRQNLECRRDAAVRLRTHGLSKRQKLADNLLTREEALSDVWPSVRGKCSEAERFSEAFLALIPAG